VTSHALSAAGASAARSPRTTAIAVALSMLVGVLVSLAAFSLVKPGEATRAAAPAGTYVAPGKAFSMRVPDGWQALSAEQLASVPGKPLAVIRQTGGDGMVVVRPARPLSASGTELTRSLGKQLGGRFEGFRPVGARFATIGGARAFVYTFERAPERTAQTLALVSADGEAYAIDAVAPGNSPAVARQAGAIVTSFRP
jgi:hypothetical protein